MTREQEEVADQICLQHGAVRIREGADDGSVVIFDPTGVARRISEDGDVVKLWHARWEKR